MTGFWKPFAVLLLLTGAIYASVYRFSFIELDDPDSVVENPHIQKGLCIPAIREAFSTYIVGNYAPLVSISYCIDRSLFGLKPGPMHVENVVLHWIAGLLLWRLIFIATGELDRSFVVAALFLIHPMHVESVAWISERKDVLSTPLLLGSMLAYVRFCRVNDPRERSIAYSCMLILFAASLLAKSMGVTLPALLLLLDVWPLRRIHARGWFWLIFEKLPLFALSIGAGVMAGFAQQAAGATSSISDLSIVNRFNNAIVSYVVYIVKLAVPTNLAIFYQHPGVRPWMAVVAAAGLLGGISALLFRARVSRPYLFIGWLWFLGTLVPVIGLVQVGSQAMADRYSYFPSIGLFIAAVWFIGDGIKNFRIKSLLVTFALALFSLKAWQQVSYWKDSQALFTHAVAVVEPNPVAHLVLANLSYNRGDLNTAAAHYRAALNPFANARAYYGLGNCLLESHPSQAIQYYRRAVNLNPRNSLFRVGLAHALWLDGQPAAAAKEAETAVSIDPGFAPALAELNHQRPSVK